MLYLDFAFSGPFREHPSDAIFSCFLFFNLEVEAKFALSKIDFK